MKTILSAILMTGLVVTACKSKKNVAATTSNGPSESHLTVLKTKIPDATMNDLKTGHSIFYGACTDCHSAKDVTGFTEEQLKKTIDIMAPKAKLAESEKAAVWKYALAVNLASKK
jgi:hypothetical protein